MKIQVGSKFRFISEAPSVRYTVGNIYEVTFVDEVGDAVIKDDNGRLGNIFKNTMKGRWEMVDETGKAITRPKIYLAHPISSYYEKEASIAVANKLREIGFEVYAPAENNSINDKTNNPTPVDIYDADMEHLENCDIFMLNLTGGHQDGTILEVGYVSKMNKENKDKGIPLIPIIAYTSNTRLHNPQHSVEGIPSASANHLVIGAIHKWGMFNHTLEEALKVLEENFNASLFN